MDECAAIHCQHSHQFGPPFPHWIRAFYCCRPPTVARIGIKTEISTIFPRRSFLGAFVRSVGGQRVSCVTLSLSELIACHLQPTRAGRAMTMIEEQGNGRAEWQALRLHSLSFGSAASPGSFWLECLRARPRLHHPLSVVRSAGGMDEREDTCGPKVGHLTGQLAAPALAGSKSLGESAEGVSASTFPPPKSN